MNIQKMMKQAQQMQRDMERVQNELEGKTYTATKPGMVSVEVNGKLEVTSIQIEPELLDLENKEILEDTLTIVLSEALKKANDDKEKSLGSLTQGLSIPGLF